MSDTYDDHRLTELRDAADDAELRHELEGRADDLLDRERQERDIWGPSPDDLEPWEPIYEYPIRRAS